MSGYTDDAIVLQRVWRRMREFIQKPFSPDELAGKFASCWGLPASKARVLAAYDEAGVRGFLRKALEQVGYGVIEAVDRKQALRQ